MPMIQHSTVKKSYGYTLYITWELGPALLRMAEFPGYKSRAKDKFN